MDDLVGFVRARLDEDAAVVREANTSPEMVTGIPRSYVQAPVALHIGRFADPARVLAEVDAKRQVLTWYVKTVEAVDELAALLERLRRKGHDTLMTEMGQEARIHQRDTLQGVLRLLALPYAAHPDYREEWRP